SVRPVCLFVAHVRAGAETAAGDTLGEVVTPDGAHAEWIRSPGQGRVMMIRHSCPVEAGAGAGHRRRRPPRPDTAFASHDRGHVLGRLGDSQLRVWGGHPVTGRRSSVRSPILAYRLPSSTTQLTRLSGLWPEGQD